MSDASQVPPRMTTPLAEDLVPAVRFLRRWWVLAFCMMLLTLCTTVGYVVFVRGVDYQVTAALFIKLGPELATPPTMSKEPLVITRREEDVKNEIEILTSPELVHQVVQELGEGFFRAPPPATSWERFKQRVKGGIKLVKDGIEEGMIQAGLRRRLNLLEKIELAITGQLSVEPVRTSDIVSIKLSTQAPEQGEIILRKLLDTYQARHLAVHEEVDVKEFLIRQTGEIRKQLHESTNRLLQFQTSADLWSSEEQQKLLLDGRNVLETQLASTRSRLAQQRAVVAGLSQAVADLPAVVELSKTDQLNPAIGDLEDRIASLGLNLVVVETSYLPGARESADRREQIRSLRSKLAELPAMLPHSVTLGLNQIRQELVREQTVRSAELRGLVDQLEVEGGQLTELNEKIRTLGASVAEYQQLIREHQLLERKYALYSENFEKADIAAVMNLAKISNIEMISAPMASKQPIRPRLSFVVGGGALAGILLALAIGFVWDFCSILTRPATM